MGFKAWFARKFFGIDISLFKKIQKEKKADADTAELADEYLKRTINQNAAVIKTAERLNRANLINASTKEIKAAMREGLEDEDDEEYDDEDDEDGERNEYGGANIEKMIIEQITGAITNKSQILKSNTAPATPQLTDLRQKAGAKFQTLTDAQLSQLDKAGFLD